MNTNKEKFYALAQSESSSVDSIIEAMMHTKKNEARCFLNVMNSIIDYYLLHECEDGEICYPIIRVSHAPEWAQEVLIKFLILKLSLHYNTDTIEQLNHKFFSSNSYNIIDDDDCKYYRKYYVPCKSYLKGILDNLSQNMIGESGHKNMIYCSEDDIRVSREDKNKYISEFYGDVDDIFTEKNLIMCQNVDANNIRKSLREHREEKEVKIDNAFIFYKNNDKTNSFESTSLKRWNNVYPVGLKNCFVFDFSDYPFRMRYEIKRCATLCKKFPMISENKSLKYQHFISFDEYETNFLFGWENHYEHKIIEDDQLMFTDLLGSFLDESEHRIQKRNHFALCLSPKAISDYQKHLKSECEDYNNDDYLLSYEWQSEVVRQITSALDNIINNPKYNTSSQYKIAVVIDKQSTPHFLKVELSHYFQSINPKATIKFYDYSALKPKNGKNSIREQCVIVFQYRPHYIREPYAKYPNSFDPYVVRDGQYIFDLIQGFVFQDMYAWDYYDYNLTMYELLTSEYRNNILGGYEKPIKPSFRRVTGETEFSDERNNTNTPQIYVKGVFDNGQSFNIPESDYILCEIDGEPQICRFSDIKRCNQLSSIRKFQKIDEIAEHLRIFIKDKSKEADERERFIRNSYCKQGKITIEEQDSETALWKILLTKKVSSIGFDNVFEMINTEQRKENQISEHQFKSWIDPLNDMMLPRNKVHQKRLFDYLGFGTTSPYLFIMRNKKATTKNGTRKFNSMVNQFLMRTLTREIDEDIFEEINNSDINDLLELQNIGDLNSLVDMLREQIHLNTVKEFN